VCVCVCISNSEVINNKTNRTPSSAAAKPQILEEEKGTGEEGGTTTIKYKSKSIYSPRPTLLLACSWRRFASVFLFLRVSFFTSFFASSSKSLNICYGCCCCCCCCNRFVISLSLSLLLYIEAITVFSIFYFLSLSNTIHFFLSNTHTLSKHLQCIS
jgi:hypothetical protein